MLLPAGDDGGEDEDEGFEPRDELVRRLLEYQRYKEAAQDLDQREVLSRDVFARSASPTEEAGPRGFREVSVFELLAALKRIIDRLPTDTFRARCWKGRGAEDGAVSSMLRREASILSKLFFAAASSRMEIIVGHVGAGQGPGDSYRSGGNGRTDQD